MTSTLNKYMNVKIELYFKPEQKKRNKYKSDLFYSKCSKIFPLTSVQR